MENQQRTLLCRGNAVEDRHRTLPPHPGPVSKADSDCQVWGTESPGGQSAAHTLNSRGHSNTHPDLLEGPEAVARPGKAQAGAVAELLLVVQRRLLHAESHVSTPGQKKECGQGTEWATERAFLLP